MEKFIDNLFPKATKEEMEAALAKIVAEGNEECKKLAEEDPMSKWEISQKQALEIASKSGLESEVSKCINRGMSPLEALAEWDLF